MTNNFEFESLKERYENQENIAFQGKAVKLVNKMFAFVGKGLLVVKLDKKRVTEMLESGEGLPYDPGNGKIGKEWVIIGGESLKKWEAYADEAKEFVKHKFKL